MTIAPKNPDEQFALTAPVVGTAGATSSFSGTSGLYATYGKRALDVTLVLIASPFIVPLILALAFVVWCKGGRPFYSQDRVGLGGRVYRMWKLRSMVHNAEAALERHLDANPETRAEWDANQKLRNDPRITSFGRVLRATSLDELPQLWNVFVGDMSLVGPRPMMTDQVGLYPGKRYYDMRPGLTCFWQVSARNDCTFQGRAKFDARYYDSMSLWTDIKLLFATVRVVMKATGR